MSFLIFIKETWRDFQHTGAIAPSSVSLAKAITEPVFRKSEALSILEVGAGTGVFTRELLDKLNTGDSLDIFEINPSFVPALQTMIHQRLGDTDIETNVRIHQSDILKLDRKNSYDFIISGLPLNNFMPDTVSRILDVLRNSLKPDGIMCFFEYLFIRNIKSMIAGKNESLRLEKIAVLLNAFLGQYELKQVRVWKNIPPAVVHIIQKK